MACVGSVKEVRIAEGNMLRSRLDLLANVGQHHIALNHTKFSFVNRDYGAMPAQVLAPAAGLGISGELLLAVRQHEFRILGKIGQPLSARSEKRQPVVRNLQSGLRLRITMQAFGKRQQTSFKFAADDGVHAERVEMVRIQWRVKPIGANMRSRIQLPQARYSVRRDSRGSVHRQMKCDQVGPTHNAFVLA